MNTEMTFEHDYAGSKRLCRVVYIEYQDGKPFQVICDHFDGFQISFDFEPDCREWEMFMFYHSGSGGKITDIQSPHYVSEGNNYWIHKDAAYKIGTDAINADQLEYPIKYNGNPNPFDHAREIYSQDYCKFCEKYWDENLCPNHHVIVDGQIEYMDGSK